MGHPYDTKFSQNQDSEFLTDGFQKKKNLVLECVYTHTCISDTVYCIFGYGKITDVETLSFR